jgi:ATP-dependent DNA helicase DinG
MAPPDQRFVPPSPVVAAGVSRCAVLTEDGEVLLLAPPDAAALLRRGPPPLLIHAPSTWARLRMRPLPSYDLLELFAFTLPARPASPTARGLALALDLALPAAGLEADVAAMPDLARHLLARLSAGRGTPLNQDAAGLAARMGRAGWGWAPFVLAALGQPDAAPGIEGLRVWRRLPEWEDEAARPAPGALEVSPGEIRARLARLLGPDAEQRPGQADYAAAAAAAFAPRTQRGDPHMVLAEAGTGTGKTLGYIAPASLWAERNHGAVWISTYTRHLQRQIDAELTKLFPDPQERRRRAVVRKGRENYLCLLNFEEAVNIASNGLADAPLVVLGLVARWARATADGDIRGGDLPGWLAELFGAALITNLADRRGECIHAGCQHWRRCFVEHTIRRARTADLVIANHALVMAQAAWGGLDDAVVPGRYVFDEGHHVFDAADAAFAAELSGVESADLRRWLLGAEGYRTRARGLQYRLEDLVAGNAALQAPLDAGLQAARALARYGWLERAGDMGPELLEGDEKNPTEAFLQLARTQVLARLAGRQDPAGSILEADLYPVPAELQAAAARLARALARIAEPLKTLIVRLTARLDDEAEELDSATRNRIEANCRSLRRRAVDRLIAWQAMLEAVSQKPPETGIRPNYIHFLRLDRQGGADRDVGLHRHWLDPSVPFATVLAASAQGLLVTSATLRDAGEADSVAAWEAAEARVGAVHLPSPSIRAAVASPFDYAGQTRAFVITDVATGDIAALAAAYRVLFMAAGGGGLGLFTAISRLKLVHARIAAPLEEAGIPLLAQHIDMMDNGTLVDVFRTEENSCLLGTDAMRDGVDVPGRALRLVVFERVPWPRPDILHRERRVHLSDGDPATFDERIARLRLRQGFGRLIRHGADRGVFVILDRRTPSRLLSAFPAGVAVQRVGLAQAAQETREFLVAAK